MTTINDDHKQHDVIGPNAAEMTTINDDHKPHDVIGPNAVEMTTINAKFNDFTKKVNVLISHFFNHIY